MQPRHGVRSHITTSQVIVSNRVGHYRLSMRTSNVLYGVNVALLATHQADAAFWREWDVFGLGGGITFFLLFNAIAMGALLVGFALVVRGHARARLAAFACSATGFVTCLLHAVFLRVDHTAFWTAPSLIVLASIALTSLALAFTARTVPIAT